MNIFKIVGKYLDQPLLVAKFQKKVPYLLTAGGAACVAYSSYKNKEEDVKPKYLQRSSLTMLFTILSALAAPKIANKIFNKHELSIGDIKKNNSNLVDNFVKNNKLEKDVYNLLEKAKNKTLSFKEIKELYTRNKIDKNFLNKLIPEPENITSKEIFSEIGRLSVLGLIPVIGGIVGGVYADIATNENWKEKLPNKIKEGTYQYLANIFLCNVGAGTALAIMEKCGVKSKSARALGMISGILTTGVIGGSVIANFISNKIVNPLFGKECKSIYSERKPEALDIGLHTDDIATVAVMSGLKWIEPALPIMYAISGYRAGIGYRNVNNCKEKKEVWN